MAKDVIFAEKPAPKKKLLLPYRSTIVDQPNQHHQYQEYPVAAIFPPITRTGRISLIVGGSLGLTYLVSQLVASFA